MATFGKTSVGGTADSIAAVTKRGCKFTAPSDMGTVTRIEAHCNRSGSGSGYAVDAAIYADSSGSPGALVADSVINLSSNIARNSAAWYGADYGTAPTLVPGNVYWLVVLFTKAGTTFSDAGASNQQASRADTLPFDDPFGGSPTFAAREMSVFVTYTPLSVFSHTGSGGVVLGGSAVASVIRLRGSQVGSGGVALAGAADAEYVPGGTVFEHVASGGFALAGAASVTRTIVGAAGGGFTLGAAATVARTFVAPASGGVVFAGAAAVARTLVGPAGGTVVLGGAAVAARTMVGPTSGGLVFAGAADASYIPAGGSVFLHTGSGGLSLAGEAIADLVEAQPQPPGGGGGGSGGGLAYPLAPPIPRPPRPRARIYAFVGSGGRRLGGAAVVEFRSAREAEELALLGLDGLDGELALLGLL